MDGVRAFLNFWSLNFFYILIYYTNIVFTSTLYFESSVVVTTNVLLVLRIISLAQDKTARENKRMSRNDIL